MATTAMMIPKQPPWRSLDYLAFVRRFPCVGCQKSPPSEPHHVAHLDIPRSVTRHGTNQKHSDMFTVSVCRGCHDLYHSERRFPKLDVSTSYERILIVQCKLMAMYLMELPEERVSSAVDVERWPVF